MKNLNILISLALVFSMLISCKADSQKMPNILDYKCGKLCWNNIDVGVTTREELLNTISNTNIDESSASESKQEALFDRRVYFPFYNGLNKDAPVVRVSTYLIGEKVVVLDLSDNLGTNFQEVVRAFGEPELVSAIKNQSGQVWISFINSSTGIFFGYIAKSEKSEITPDIQILRITLFDVALYQDLLEADWLLPGYRERNLYPWDGYGKIEEHYWPPRKQ